MIRSVSLAVMGAMAIILDISIMPLLSLGGSSLSLVGLLVANLALVGLLEPALALAVAGGMVFDLLSPRFGGVTLMMLILWTIFFIVSRYRLIVSQLFIVSILLAISGVLMAVPGFLIERSLSFLLSSALLHTLAGTAMFLLLRRYLLRLPSIGR